MLTLLRLTSIAIATNIRKTFTDSHCKDPSLSTYESTAIKSTVDLHIILLHSIENHQSLWKKSLFLRENKKTQSKFSKLLENWTHFKYKLLVASMIIAVVGTCNLFINCQEPVSKSYHYEVSVAVIRKENYDELLLHCNINSVRSG